MSSSENPTSESAPEPDPADAAVERIAEHAAALDSIIELPLGEHQDVYEHIHAALQGALAEIDGA